MAAEPLLSRLLGLLLLGSLLPASLTAGVGSLNLEELSEMRYGIEILPLPVMGGQVRRRRAARIWGQGQGEKQRKKGCCGARGAASGEWGRVGGGFTMFAENRRLSETLSLRAGAGRAGLPAVSFGPSSSSLALRSLQKWEHPLPPLARRTHLEDIWLVLFWLGFFSPQDAKRALIVLTDASLSLPPCPLTVPHFYPRAKLRTW